MTENMLAEAAGPGSTRGQENEAWALYKTNSIPGVLG